jgi:hypothetical protein
MCKRAFILVLVVAIIGIAFLRFRSIARSRVERLPHQPHPVSHDVGAAMRQITGTDPASVKPWVIDAIAYRNAHVDRQWIVGRSDRPATSEAEAMESARADAARQLYPIVQSRLSGWRIDQRWVQSRIDAEVGDGQLDSDTFVEQFDRPYGKVYAGAVLVDASADRIEPVIRSARHELAARHRRAGIHMAVAGVLLIVTWLAYALLNSVTRGYATMRLRVIAVVITLGVLLLI